MAVKTKKWILVVDDEADSRELICRNLASLYGNGIKIVEAQDGSVAEKKLKNQTFHLIITDIRMPKKDGEELIDIVRSSEFNDTTPIVAISAYKPENIEKTYPFVSYLDKPISKEQLKSAVDTYFTLGSTTKMIEGSIFSSLIDSSVGFLKEALSRNDFEVGEMKLKKVGETIEADHAAVIQIQVGKVKNTFSVLCSKATLEEIREKSEKVHGKSLDIISRSLGYVILKHVLIDCGIIDSNEVRSEDVSNDRDLLTNKKGIIVSINALNINYRVFATTNDKSA